VSKENRVSDERLADHYLVAWQGEIDDFDAKYGKHIIGTEYERGNCDTRREEIEEVRVKTLREIVPVLRHELQSLRSKPVAGVEVKPLEWSRSGWVDALASPDGLGVWYAINSQNPKASTPPFSLKVFVGTHLKTSTTEMSTALGTFDTTEEAKAAAEADYRQRILSTLSLPAQEPAGALSNKFHIDGDAAKAISFMLGSSDEDDDTWSDALVWVGNLEDDDGKQVYGLHLANAEYPEEGGITLATFDPQPEAVITEEMVERACKAVDTRLGRRTMRAALTAALQGETK